MTARGYLRGQPIHWDEPTQQWCYDDTEEPTAETWRDRPCGHCGEYATPEGHDACLGTVPLVRNACCGHGRPREAYLQFFNGGRIQGIWALRLAALLRALKELRK